ncbi:MAG: type II toxin-antitoxin system death-on-curing family toxin [Synechococcus sp.]
MIRFLQLGEVLELHRQLIITSGGSPGLRDLGLLEAALSQPRLTFSGDDLYPTIIDKAVCLGFRSSPIIPSWMVTNELVTPPRR